MGQYYYLTIEVVMRDCKSELDAQHKCASLMPQNPDENTQHMESWFIVKTRNVDNEHDLSGL